MWEQVWVTITGTLSQKCTIRCSIRRSTTGRLPLSLSRRVRTMTQMRARLLPRNLWSSTRVATPSRISCLRIWHSWVLTTDQKQGNSVLKKWQLRLLFHGLSSRTIELTKKCFSLVVVSRRITQRQPKAHRYNLIERSNYIIDIVRGCSRMVAADSIRGDSLQSEIDTEVRS